MEERLADLHVHTFYSDSTFSPEEVIEKAKEMNLSAVAICDHDCVDGIGPSIKAAENSGIEIIPGVELTVGMNDVEIHVLGYFVDWKAGWFKDRLKVIQDSRVERIYKMTALLKEQGIDISPDDVFKISGKGTVARPHVAMAMLKAKKIRTLDEAFRLYIGDSKPCYVGHARFSAQEAMEIILKSGGVPVLAHPRVMGKDEFIPELKKYGLRGIEVYHADQKGAVAKKYLNIAEHFGLLATGGSDCHGLGKSRILMGTVTVPYSFVEKLKEESLKIRNERKTV